MTFGPRTLIGPPGIGTVHLFRPKFGWSRACVFLEKLGVVVFRRSQFLVSIVQARGCGCSEVDSPFILLNPDLADLEGWVVTVVNNHFEVSGLIPARSKLVCS